MHFKKIAAIMAAAITAASVSGVVYASEDDIVNPNHLGSYHEINNDDSFLMVEQSDVVLNAYYYEVGSELVCVRDVITDFSISMNLGTTDMILNKGEVELCDERGFYLNKILRGFSSQGKVKSTSVITAHGKTYKK